MATGRLTEDEHQRIAAAIRAAETRTSGEIYCVMARISDDYLFPAALAVTLACTVVTAGVALVVERWWSPPAISVLIAAQLLAIAAALAVLRFAPATRLFFVTPGLRYARAHDNAMRQFLARNVHRTARRTGVLIFVSVAERYAEVVADSGIHAKVEQAAWDGIVSDLVGHARQDRLADGFAQAVATAGDLLARHFPPLPDDRDELDDHLVEL